MKILRNYLSLFLLIPFIASNATNVSGRFVEISETDDSYSIKLELSCSPSQSNLGGATLVIAYDPNTLSFPSVPVAGINFVFHNFNSGNYSAGTVTQPVSNQLWINIELLNDNQGDPVGNSQNWTDVVTLNFSKVSSIVNPKMEWKTESPFWSIYGEDNKTLWNTDSFNSITVLEEIDSEAPKDYNLAQNYPNPFNPTTNINFSIIQSGKVKLAVYNITGEKVADLVDEFLESGNHSIAFNASDLASGVYIYRLDAENGYSDMKKMILLK